MEHTLTKVALRDKKNDAAKAKATTEQLLDLLRLSGAYITATKASVTSATKEFKRLDSRCKRYGIETNHVISEAVDYFSRRPNSIYI